MCVYTKAPEWWGYLTILPPTHTVERLYCPWLGVWGTILPSFIPFNLLVAQKSSGNGISFHCLPFQLSFSLLTTLVEWRMHNNHFSASSGSTLASCPQYSLWRVSWGRMNVRNPLIRPERVRKGISVYHLWFVSAAKCTKWILSW